MKKYSVLLTVISVLTGCATAGQGIVGTPVFPDQFSNLDCEQVRQEMTRLPGRVIQQSGRLDEAATNDKTMGVIGTILYRPALFALGGTKPQAAELGRLKRTCHCSRQTSHIAGDRWRRGGMRTRNLPLYFFSAGATGMATPLAAKASFFVARHTVVTVEQRGSVRRSRI